MEILYNSDNHLTATQELRSDFDSVIESELNRFRNHVIRVHIYLSDVNSSRQTPNDKQCTVEVQVAGLKNIAATANGDTISLSLLNALEKLSSALDSALGRTGRA